MRLLLDTHAFIWMVDRPENLGQQVIELLEDTSNELYLSAASIWEISTKHRIGKLPGGDIIVANINNLLSTLKIIPLSISFEHASVSGSLDWSHRDPFDRMLAAQCIIENLILATRDAAFKDLDSVQTAW